MSDFWFILQRASLFGLAALAVALLLQWVLSNRVPSAWRVWIWRVALIQTALALVPLAPLSLSVLPTKAPVVAPIVEAPIVEEPISPAVEAPISAMESAPSAEVMPPLTLETPAISSAPVNESNYAPIKLSWRELAVWIYALGIGVQLLLLARSARRVRRNLRACTPIDSASLSVVAARLNIANIPSLLQSDGGAPFLTGIFRPTIVLPRALMEAGRSLRPLPICDSSSKVQSLEKGASPAAFTNAQLEAILAHELAHHKRRDLAWNAFLWALQTLLWFHPLSFIARRYHALEVESACDELTLQLTQIAPKSYGALLLNSMNKHNSPLTAGVNDGFFALKTRLKRLGQTPIQPRKRVKLLFGVALLVSFASVVPIKLTARAQSPLTATELSGTVKDGNNKPVAGATVYLMKWQDFGGLPLETVVADANGRYRFSDEFGDNKNIVIFADAGARGIGQGYFWQHGRKLRVSNPIIAAPAPVKLLFVDPSGKRAANVPVRVGQIGGTSDERWSLPRAIAGALQTFTNARGEAVFPALPQGAVARFYLADHKFYQTKYGEGDVRGGQYAPLASDEVVTVGASNAWKTISLVPPIRVQGRVTTPDGKSKSDVLILARRINAAEASGDSNGREMLLPQTRTGADGRYVMDGLRPGLYRFELPPEKTLVRDYVGPIQKRALRNPVNTVDFPLARGGVIRGVVLQQGTKTPLSGSTVGLVDSKQVYQYEKTDARGAFQFRAQAGQAFLWIQKGDKKLPVKVSTDMLSFTDVRIKTFKDTGEKSLSLAQETKSEKMMIKGIIIDKARRAAPFNPSELIFLPVKSDTTRELTIESAAKPQPTTATLSGQIKRPDGTGESAIVMVRPAADLDFKNAIEKPTDARGRYSIDGIKPGRYKITAALDDVAKTKWAAPSLKQNLAAGANRADFQLSRGALIEGVVWAKSNHHPIAGVEVLTADADGDGTIVKTDVHGQFQFRVAPGAVAVRVHSHGKLPGGYAMPTKSQFDFDLKDGDKKTVVFDLPSATAVKAARMFTRPKPGTKPTATVVGIARDESGQPLAGVRVWAYTQLYNRGIGSGSVMTGADGAYRFDDFPAGGKVAVIAKRKSYGVLPTPNDDKFGLNFVPLPANSTRAIDVTLRIAPTTLAGQVLKADGTLAVGYHVSPQNMRNSVTVKANGKFWMAEVWSGPRDLYVYDAMSRRRWGPYRAQNNQRDLSLRISEQKRDKDYVLGYK